MQQDKELPSNVVASTAMARVNSETFYNELLELGFGTQEATEVISWVKIIKNYSPSFFSGKKTCTIKACLAYIGGQVFGNSRQFSQHRIAKFYNLYNWTINRSYKLFLSALKEASPSALIEKHFST